MLHENVTGGYVLIVNSDSPLEIEAVVTISFPGVAVDHPLPCFHVRGKLP